jgi:peptide chain release factor 1
MSERAEVDQHQRLAAVADEFRELEARLADPDTAADPARLRSVTRRFRELEPVVAVFRSIEARTADLAAARELLEMATGGERAHLDDEVEAASADIERLGAELRELLLPRDPNAGRAVIIEIRGAEGGEEANLFARDLYDMYLAYAANRRWKVEVLSHAPSDLGGSTRSRSSSGVTTPGSDSSSKAGPHRVQRVPVTESQGRVHTSSATVAVLPEVDEVEVSIDDRDLEIDVYRSSGAGGQHVNTTDSAVRVTHVPTGLVVTMQDERSQLQNRSRAMQVLRARLHEIAERERDAEQSAERRSQVGGGGRSEKIRTYNYKENRVTDHRIGFTVYRLSDVLAGDLDLVVDALVHDERTRQLAEFDG